MSVNERVEAINHIHVSEKSDDEYSDDEYSDEKKTG